MDKFKKMLNTVVKDKKLYNECGSLFKYMGEVRINFSSLQEHNVPWQMTQILEIIYSNKLDGTDLDFKNTIVAYSTNYLKNNFEKKASWANFEATFFVSKIRRKKECITLSSLAEIVNIIWKNYGLKNKFEINDFTKNLDSLCNYDIFEKLANGTLTNNPLYFFPIYLYLIEKMIKNLNHKAVIRTIFINLYLMKNKLLFAPSIPFSYPLYQSYGEYINAISDVDENPEKIIQFSEIVFDLLNQSSVVSRAFISNYSKISSSLNNLIDITNKKVINEDNKKVIMKMIPISPRLIDETFENKKDTHARKIFNLLNKHDLLTEISENNKMTIYVFTEYFKTFLKLAKNKTQKTTKIFVLKEKLN